MVIRKRNGQEVEFEASKINKAISAAFISAGEAILEEQITAIVRSIENEADIRTKNGQILTVEEIQDYVEIGLIDVKQHKVVRNFILYRTRHTAYREQLNRFSAHFPNRESVISVSCQLVIKHIQREYDNEIYPAEMLLRKFESFLKNKMTDDELIRMLTKAALELTSKEAPGWEYIASAFLSIQLHDEINSEMTRYELNGFASKYRFLSSENLIGSYMLENYSLSEVDELELYMDTKRDGLLTYSSLDLLMKRYLIRNNNAILESPQEMFMGIAMHLAIPEGHHRVFWAKKFYDILSKLQVTMATPTMANARKPYHQLSSCFIDTVPDSLDGIYRSIANFSQVSKFGGGMGIYFGKVRAVGSDIRGYKGAAGGVMRWIKLANDTAVAVDQLGVRQGAVAVYLDAWHKDLPEFLQMKTNNGDDRLKAHDVFPAISYPDLFWRLARDNMDATWYMMCPHEIAKQKGYSLEDSFGEEWEQKYTDCVNDPAISKREISIKDLVRLILKSVVETGTPFCFYRDTVNRLNPNSHAGVIYASNLCTEIAQNMSAIESVSQETIQMNGETIVVTTTKAGDFVVCNLASLVLGNIQINLEESNGNTELDRVIPTIIRALDNVLDLNYYPVPYAKITNQRYRPIGLGSSGYHHLLAKNKIQWESDEHLNFADKLYERINFLAIQASSALAVEKGSYSVFGGSDWQTGLYFDKRDYTSEKWLVLKENVAKNGLRNGYLLAIAPTGTTSIIAGTTAAVDPIMSRYYLEEKKGMIVPRVAPDLTPETFWYYKSAHTIDQNWIVDAAAVRQRHIDQAQSVNLFITPDFTMRQVLSLYIRAWEKGVKTIYYVRSQSLEVDECDVCSA